jgi:hypothetical protein
MSARRRDPPAPRPDRPPAPPVHLPARHPVAQDGPGRAAGLCDAQPSRRQCRERLGCGHRGWTGISRCAGRGSDQHADHGGHVNDELGGLEGGLRFFTTSSARVDGVADVRRRTGCGRVTRCWGSHCYPPVPNRFNVTKRELSPASSSAAECPSFSLTKRPSSFALANGSKEISAVAQSPPCRSGRLGVLRDPSGMGHPGAAKGQEAEPGRLRTEPGRRTGGPNRRRRLVRWPVH